MISFLMPQEKLRLPFTEKEASKWFSSAALFEQHAAQKNAGDNDLDIH